MSIGDGVKQPGSHDPSNEFDRDTFAEFCALKAKAESERIALEASDRLSGMLSDVAPHLERHIDPLLLYEAGDRAMADEYTRVIAAREQGLFNDYRNNFPGFTIYCLKGLSEHLDRITKDIATVLSRDSGALGPQEDSGVDRPSLYPQDEDLETVEGNDNLIRITLPNGRYISQAGLVLINLDATRENPETQYILEEFVVTIEGADGSLWRNPEINRDGSPHIINKK